MKFPVAVTGGTAPSASSVALVAVTYPGVRGSRTGGAGRFAGACAETASPAATIPLTRTAGHNRGVLKTAALETREASVGVSEPIERDAHAVHDPEVQAAHLAVVVAGVEVIERSSRLERSTES